MATLFLAGGGGAASIRVASNYSDKVIDTDARKKELFYLTRVLETEKRALRKLPPLPKRLDYKFDRNYPDNLSARRTPAIFKR